jgi:transcriptional regulator GlxA family with amidase domain
MEGYITMSKQELSRLELMQKGLEKQMAQTQVAELLHLSRRQTIRLCISYKQYGPECLISKCRGKAKLHSVVNLCHKEG